MALMDVVFGLWQFLTLSVQPVVYEQDEETRERMKQREEMLNREMARLWQEVDQLYQEQMNQERSGFAWASPILSALQHWQCWAVAAVLLLLFGLCWCLRKRSREPERDANGGEWFFARSVQRPVQKWDDDCEAVKKLVQKCIFLLNYVSFNTWYPVLENAIGVGSAFEGWSPREEDITYQLLVPLKPPRGHIFYLEPGPMSPTRNFGIRVHSLCTCETEQRAGKTRCFLHDPEEAQSRNKGPSILHDLCTDSYLDVQKTAHWLQKTLRRSWKFLPESDTHHLTLLPSDRSCKFRVTQGWEKSFFIELMFGVQQGNSDIFLSSQNTEAAQTPSTMWAESYAVAEMKFFRHIACQAEPDTTHVRCLQLCIRTLLDRHFPTDALKTVLMHLLTTIPLSEWGRTYFLERMEDILHYLQSCLEENRLNHFFTGNANVPKTIMLPHVLQMAKPLNLFWHLEQDPDAHEDVWLDFLTLRHRLRKMMLQWLSEKGLPARSCI